MTKAIVWYRKDLRVSDHAALNLAIEENDSVYCIATADQIGAPFESLSQIRQNSLRSSWQHLNAQLSNRLRIVRKPVELLEVATYLGVSKVYVTNLFDTNGVKELQAIAKDFKVIDVELVRVGSNYAIEPGTVRKSDGTPYRVYTPFFNEWMKQDPGLPIPIPNLDKISPFERDTFFDAQLPLGNGTIAGELQALKTLHSFLQNRVEDYAENRNRADLGGTSHLSHALSHGEIHPRTILSALPSGPGGDVFRKEIAWREFYADVLWNKPSSLTEYLDSRFEQMRYDEPGDQFEAWKAGKTGFPMVDAGMRQLLTTGWMHNRVRMIVASFLVKDLHIEWQHGASWFEENLTDFDPASNSHGWQWTAGCGTDASPYFRVFNPISQGFKFDPNGDYVRKYVPELRHLSGSRALEPWEVAHGYSFGYPKRIVDHAVERIESLARLEEIKRI